VAELVDAQVSGTCGRKVVEVRVFSWAPFNILQKKERDPRTKEALQMTDKDTTIKLHQGDLPNGLDFGDSVAIDTEATGLRLGRDRLCLVQLSAGDGVCHLVQFEKGNYDAPNLKALFADGKVTKLFHFARFDLMMIQYFMGVSCTPVYCTRTASKLARTYTDRHGLKDLCKEFLKVELSKEQQSSDWAAAKLSNKQLRYAAMDVRYLHDLRKRLDAMLKREGREELAQACFDFLPWRVALDIEGWNDVDIFAH
jgi:ribonuclease D